MIGKFIQKKRLELSLTPKELANKLNISIQRLNNFENERRIPPLTLLGNLSVVLDFDINNFNKKHNKTLLFDHNLFKSSLLEYRQKNNVTLNELSEKLNISRQTISKWEKGESYPNIDTYYEICITLDILPSSLICTNNPDFVPKKDSLLSHKYPYMIISSLIIIIILFNFLFFKNINSNSKSKNSSSNILSSSSQSIPPSQEPTKLMSDSTIKLIYKCVDLYNKLNDNDKEKNHTIYFNDSNLENINFYQGEDLILPYYFDDEKYIDHYLFNNIIFSGLITLDYNHDINLTPVYITYEDYLSNMVYSVDDTGSYITKIISLKEGSLYIVPESINGIRKIRIAHFSHNRSTFITNQSEEIIIDGIHTMFFPSILFFNSNNIQIINYNYQIARIELLAFNQYSNYSSTTDFFSYNLLNFLYINSNSDYNNFIRLNDNINFLYLDGCSSSYYEKFIAKSSKYRNKAKKT